MTPFFLFFGLMVATGFIAHWSDNLGKKLGKKRVSLFGLRPKQTATLITVASSLLIMTVTFAAMLLTYIPLREALFTFDKERAANQKLSADLELLEFRQKESLKRLRATNAVLGKTNSDLSRTQTNLKQARAAQKTAVEAAKSAVENERSAKQGEHVAQSGRDQAKRGETAARRNESAARRREQSARQNESRARQNESRARQSASVALSKQATAQRNLGFARRSLEGAKILLEKARGELKTAQNAARTAKNEVRVAQNEVKFARGNLLKSRTELLKSRTELLAGQKEVEESRVQLETQQTNLAQLESEIAQRQQEIVQRRQEIKDLQNDYKDTVLLAARALTGPTLISNRETLAVRTIPARLDAATIANLLRDLLLSARSNVKRLGEDNKRLGLGLTVVPREVEIDGQIREADEALQLSILAQSLSGATPSSVRVVAARNHSVQEPDIKVAFDVVPIRPAYRRDEIIATSVIDGRRTGIGRNDGRTAAKIFNQLLALVNEGQRLAENERKVEPPLGRDTQFYAPDTNERIFDAIYDIQALGVPARVRLRAAEDLSTAAPLRVRIEVLPATATT